MGPQYFEAGDTLLQSGTVLPGVRLAYAIHGTLNAARHNGIVYPSHYAGTHNDNAWNIGASRALDPEKDCIIVPNLLGNGVSPSPPCPPRVWLRRTFRWLRCSTIFGCSTGS